jgi:hypothetical protein
LTIRIPNVGRNALDLDSSQPAQSPVEEHLVPDLRQTTPTPSEWPESEHGSQAHLSSEIDAETDRVSQSPCSSFDENNFSIGGVSESIRAPSHPLSLDDAHSDNEDIEISCQDANPEKQPDPVHEGDENAVPPSLLPYPSSPNFPPFSSTSRPIFPDRDALRSHSPSSSSPCPPLQEHPKIAEIIRRVPYPAPPSSLDPNRTERILVPSSDTSGSVSQGISQEQRSQLLSQRNSKSQSSQPPDEKPFLAEMHISHLVERKGTGSTSSRLLSTPSSINKGKDLQPNVTQEVPLPPSYPRAGERQASVSVSEGDGSRFGDGVDGDGRMQQFKREASASVVQDSEEDMLDDDDAETLSMLSGTATGQQSPSVNVVSATEGQDTKDVPATPANSPHPEVQLIDPKPVEARDNPESSSARATRSRQKNHVLPKHSLQSVSPSAETDPVRKRISRADQDSVQPWRRNDDHDAVAWSAPSFLQAKGKGKAVPTTYKHTLSGETSKAPSIPRKRSKISDNPEQISSTSRETSQQLSRAASRSHHSDQSSSSSHRPRSGVISSDQRQDKRNPPPVADVPFRDLSKMKRSRNSVSSSRSSIDSGGFIGQGPTKRRKLTKAVSPRALQAEGGPRKEEEATTSGRQLHPAKKLKGFMVNFDNIPIDTNKGPDLGWERFQDILKKTGHLRWKALQRSGDLGLR